MTFCGGARAVVGFETWGKGTDMLERIESLLALRDFLMDFMTSSRPAEGGGRR